MEKHFRRDAQQDLNECTLPVLISGSVCSHPDFLLRAAQVTLRYVPLIGLAAPCQCVLLNTDWTRERRRE